MKEGAYLKYKFSDASFKTIELVYVEVEKVHEQTVDIRIAVSHSENGPYSVYYGFLDLEAGGFTPLSGDRYPFYEEFWINPERVNKPVTSGFPPNNKDFSRVDCWILDSSETSLGVVRRWYDKVTGILIEVSLLVDGLTNLTGVLYETDIPVGNQLVTSVETYPVFLVGACLAIIVGTVALVMFLLRRVRQQRTTRRLNAREGQVSPGSGDSDDTFHGLHSDAGRVSVQAQVASRSSDILVRLSSRNQMS
jgi:hypothetical protein